jgi:hypothetical protein
MFRSKLNKGLRMIIVGSLSTAGLIFLTPTASAEQVSIQGDGGVWVWSLDLDFPQFNNILDLEIYETSDLENEINRDGYDGWGRGTVNDVIFDWFGSSAEFEDGELVGSEIIIPGTAVGAQVNEDTYTVSFSNNNVTYLIESTDPTDELVIFGDLGSDGYSFYTTLGSHFISYQRDTVTGLPTGGDVVVLPGPDPIFKWETNGFIDFENENDEPTVFITGQRLELTQYAYAYRNDGFTSPEEFFASFLRFIDEDKTRTDVFDINYWTAPAPAPVPAPKPVETYVRKSTNLQFNEAMYGSDKLSDPDGQLRTTVDAIDAKYGYLIK